VWSAEFPRAIVSLVLYIVVLGQWWNLDRVSAQLSGMFQDDFRSSIVQLDGSVDFDDFSYQLTNIADTPETVCENDHSERAEFVVLTELQKVNSVIALFDAEHSSGNTTDLADVVAGVDKWQAISPRKAGEAYRYQWRKKPAVPLHVRNFMLLGLSGRALVNKK
jgi:hypothetical protein